MFPAGWRLVIVGGNWNNGLNAGFYWNSNNASSISNANVGGRLLVFKIQNTIPAISTALAEKLYHKDAA